MTIAIAAYGPGAGGAVLEGLRAAELLGRGAIGGFAVFSTIAGGRHLQCCTQRGGAAALDLSAEARTATCAAVISSGPDRPEPLSQFLAGDAQALVTGHRLPNRPGAGGVPVNADVLDRMGHGQDAATAVAAVISENPELDAGLIAVTPQGALALGNTARVTGRGDVLKTLRQNGGRGFALTCNSIHTARDVALEDILAAVIDAALGGRGGRYLLARMDGCIEVSRGSADRVTLDAGGRVASMQIAEPNFGAEAARVTLVHRGAAVWQEGSRLGRALTEVFAAVTPAGAVPVDPPDGMFLVERDTHVAA